MERNKRDPRRYNDRQTHASFQLTEQRNTRHPQPQHSSMHHNQRPSRKRRFETYNQSTHHSNEPCPLNGPPAFKRARFNHYNHDNHHTNTLPAYNHNYYPQHHSQTQPNMYNNQSTKFRQQPSYPPNAKQSRNGNYSQHPNQAPKKKEMEQDFHRITQRMRQIDIGKATEEYQNYIALIPKNKRQSHHPRSPNPRYKMPNKHWKTAVNRWRKALHAFDGMAHKNEGTSAGGEVPHKNTQKGAESTDKNVGKFCCEKCCQEFAKFDEWQKHREKCNGKGKENINREKNVKPNEMDKKNGNQEERDEAESEDEDLFKLDQDIDLNFMESTRVKEKEETKESSLLMALNDVLNESDDELF